MVVILFKVANFIAQAAFLRRLLFQRSLFLIGIRVRCAVDRQTCRERGHRPRGAWIEMHV
ncbi:hypothetical protein NC00_18115 [Xanthomonas cannabis pv. phaseoli]|uniref:Secreted protein n=1 Tax=Xanthomonas cannabis pv. phaseoli TaxID=1885902 RepID=A0AB34P4A1_9XANT|nr:hypothetical protein NC00_18115 [Xanthomonas cannabis pv. phaseoli]